MGRSVVWLDSKEKFYNLPDTPPRRPTRRSQIGSASWDDDQRPFREKGNLRRDPTQSAMMYSPLVFLHVVILMVYFYPSICYASENMSILSTRVKMSLSKSIQSSTRTCHVSGFCSSWIAFSIGQRMPCETR